MMVWNVRRRDVLGAGALGVAAAGISGLPGAASASARSVTIVEETAVPESRQFAAALADAGIAAQIVRIDRSLNGLLHKLDGADGLVVGLTSDPAAMIAGQLLVEGGARSRLTWQHHFVSGRWQHRTEGSARLLEGSQHAWPVAVAHQLGDALRGPSGLAAATCHSGACSLAPSSPGMLVSWAYEIGGNLS